MKRGSALLALSLFFCLQLREARQMNNLRMWAYSMIAVGAINWDYQRRNQHVIAHSLLIILPGLILLGMTFLPAGVAILQKKTVRAAWLIVGVAALIFAFTNK